MAITIVEKILSLDMSTKTGWAFFESSIPNGVFSSAAPDLRLIAYGQIPPIHTPDGEYPGSFIKWAHLCFNQIFAVIEKYKPDVLVIEETSAGSKAIYTQKILEWIHFLVGKFIVDTRLKTVYLLTEEWRRETGCLMSAEEKKRNSKVSRLKAKQKKEIVNDESLTEVEKAALLKKVRAKVDGKIVGRTGRKHVNVRRANEVFGSQLSAVLRKKDEDTADSLLLGYAYHLRRSKSV